MTEARESNIVNAFLVKSGFKLLTLLELRFFKNCIERASTITGNNQALFVIDGVPFDNTNYGNAGSGGGRDLPNGAASINPDDIESVTVLPTYCCCFYGIHASKGLS